MIGKLKQGFSKTISWIKNQYAHLELIPRLIELFPRRDADGHLLHEPYSVSCLGKDCLSGIIVGIVALPLAMGFSIASGATPAQGLYTAIVAGFCISAFGGSRFQIGGPTGAFVVIITGIIARHGMAGLISATVIAGITLILMGLFGLGKFIKFIPYPVTTGFTTGIGILIFSQQIKDFFGLDIKDSAPEFIEKWIQFFKAANTIDLRTLCVGLCTLLIIIFVRKFYPRLPSAVIGVLVCTLIAHLLQLPIETIGSRFGGIPATLPVPVFPEITPRIITSVFPDAITIAMLAAIESLLSAVVADGMTGDRHNSNTELIAQGVGNIASGIFGGIPATGAIARTATNIKSGATSPVSGIIHAVVLVLFILFLGPLTSAIPLATLSAVLITVAWDMSNLSRFFHIIRTAPMSDTTVLITTAVLTILFDLTFAVEVGVVMAVFLFLRRMIETGCIKAENNEIIAKLAYGDIDKRTEDSIRALAKNDIDIFEITGPFFFGVSDMLQVVLQGLPKTPKKIILRMRDVPAIDSTGITALESFLINCRKRKIKLVFCEMQQRPFKMLEKSGYIADIGIENICESLEDAVNI
ncbi:sodium-independent anion transporter [Spirochaetia bacterium]|nr:sodium-independent anion transporter [Spirochaetia bacterium]